jgi:hypothetical protein
MQSNANSVNAICNALRPFCLLTSAVVLLLLLSISPCDCDCDFLLLLLLVMRVVGGEWCVSDVSDVSDVLVMY